MKLISPLTVLAIAILAIASVSCEINAFQNYAAPTSPLFNLARAVRGGAVIEPSNRLVQPFYIDGTAFAPDSAKVAAVTATATSIQPQEEKNKTQKKRISPILEKTKGTITPSSRPSGLFSLLDKSNNSPTVLKLREHSFVLTAGLLLAFNAGYINGCCLSGMLLANQQGVGVSAVTGAYTQAGLALGAGNFFKLFSNLKIIACFMGGSMLSGMIQPRPVPNRVSQGYGPTFLLGSLLLTISATLVQTQQPDGRAFLYFAALANGLQNAMSSMYTSNLIRSTHMSGITSDMGMFLGQMIRGNYQNAWRFIVLVSLSSFFLMGGAISYHAVLKFKSMALIFNAILFAAVGLGIVEYTSYTKKVSLWTAATGNWTWKVNDSPPSKETLRKMFVRHDPQGKGYLNVDEFSALLSEAGINMSDFGLRQVFQYASMEKGRMTQDEVMALIYCDEDGECELV